MCFYERHIATFWIFKNWTWIADNTALEYSKYFMSKNIKGRVISYPSFCNWITKKSLLQIHSLIFCKTFSLIVLARSCWISDERKSAALGDRALPLKSSLPVPRSGSGKGGQEPLLPQSSQRSQSLLLGLEFPRDDPEPGDLRRNLSGNNLHFLISQYGATLKGRDQSSLVECP